MANGEDHIRYEATFNRANELAAKMAADIEAEAAELRATGEEARAVMREAQAELLRGAPAAGEREAPQIEEAISALRRENVIKQLGREIDIEMLDAIREQTQALIDQLEVVERLQTTSRRMPLGYSPAQAGASTAEQRAALEARLAALAEIEPQRSGPVVVPPTRRTSAFEGLAGQRSQQEAFNTALAEEERIRARLLAEEQAQLEADRARLAEQKAIADWQARASAVGMQAGLTGRPVPSKTRTGILAGPKGVNWTEEDAALAKYNMTIGEYEGFERNAAVSTQALTDNVTRLGMAQAEASDSMRRHGALTTEYLQALARGETTIQEFGFQLGSTVAKFGGWAVAAAATYTAFGGLVEFTHGATDAASAAQRLSRTIDKGFDASAATQSIIQLSSETNVSVKEAGDAIFQFSRTFHTLADASQAARDGISLLKLDNVSLADTVKLSTSLYQEFGVTLGGLHTIYNMLAAGQREYSARISDTIPLMRTAAGAVANAGGDPQQLAQLAIIATRTYPGQGGNIGTALARAAAVDIPKNLTALRSTFGLGYGQEQHDPTELLLHAIRISGNLGYNDRQRLSSLIFEPRFGARYAGIFGPQGARLEQQIATNITPGATQNALQSELDKELATAHERLKSITNELQRMGAAFGASGVINSLTGLASGGVKAAGALSTVITAFDSLPGPVKELIEVLTAARLAMLFTSRTRFGSTLADVTGLSKLPGFGASEAQSARFELRAGTTQAIEGETQRWMQSRARLISLGVRQLELEKQAADISAEIAQAGTATEAQAARRNAIQQKIVALQREQEVLEAEEAAQQATREQLITQRTGLTRTRGPNAMTDEEVLALYGRTSAGTAGAAGGAGAGEATFAAVMAQRATALRAQLGFGEAAVGAAAETTVLQGLRNTMGTFGDRLMGLVEAIDPMLAAFVLLPVAGGLVKQAIDNANQAAQRAQDALTQALPGNAAQQLRERAQLFAQRATETQQADLPHQVLPYLGLNFLKNTIDPQQPSPLAQSARNLSRHYADYEAQFKRDADLMVTTRPGQQRLYRETQQLEAAAAAGAHTAFAGHPEAIAQTIDQFNNDLQSIYQASVAMRAAKATGPAAQLNLLSRLSDTQLQQWGKAYSDRSQVYGLSPNDLSGAIGAYMTQAVRFRNSSDPTQLQAITTAQGAVSSAVNKNVTELVSASKTAGSYGGAMADLGKARSGVAEARTAVQQWVDQMRRTWGNTPGVMKAVNEAATQLNQMIDSSVSNILQQQLTDIKSQSDLRTSRIGGISPEADIARMQSDLRGLQQQLQTARGAGDWEKAAELQTQVNTQKRSIFQRIAEDNKSIIQAAGQLAEALVPGISPESDIERARISIQNAERVLQADEASGAGTAAIMQDRATLAQDEHNLQQLIIQNARSIAEATGNLAEARITGITPADDIARARANIAKDQSLLEFDRAHNAGQAAITNDMANLLNDQRSLNETLRSTAQQIASDAAGLIQAETDLASAQELSPIKQAEIELQGAIRTLATIHPQDYKTYQEYQAAVIAQQARIVQDRRNVTTQIVDTDMQTLQFEVSTQRISDQQYIAGLEGLLKMKRLTQQQRQQILQEIYNVEHASAVNLNTANIRLPTTYEVRRALATAMRRGGRIPQNTGTVINHHVTNTVSITVNAGNAGQMRRVATMLDRTTKGNLTGRARAAGLI